MTEPNAGTLIHPHPEALFPSTTNPRKSFDQDAQPERKDIPAMTQPTLFPEDPCHGRHKDNPESRAAFDALITHLSRLQEMVLSYAEERPAGVTVKQVRRDLGLEHQTASARLTELMAGGLLERTGKRRDRCAILAVTDLGKRTLRAWREKSTAAA